MSVYQFPAKVMRQDIEAMREALQEVTEAVYLLSQDVSDALVLQHIDNDIGDLGRNHVELIVSLQGTAKKMQQLGARLEAMKLGES